MEKSFKKDENIIILFLILLIAAFLRIFNLSYYPTEINSEEAMLGWRAKSIFLTGMDETGRRFPLVFSTFNGYQLPFSTYLLIPFVFLCDLKPWVVRIPFVLINLFSLLFFYYIVGDFFKNKKLALWATFIMGFSPWSIYLSRYSSSVCLGFSLFLIGLYFYLKNQKIIFRILGVLFFTLSLWTDKTMWFFIIPFWFLFNIFFVKKKSLKILTGEFFLFFLLILLLFLSYFRVPQAKLDFLTSNASLFQDISIINSLNALRGEDVKAGFSFLGKVFHNKFFYGQKIVINFLSHFNPRFYFISGDGNPHHGWTNFGPLFFVFLFPLFWGIKKIIESEKAEKLKFLFLWFCLGVFPSLFMINSPDQEKVIFVFPVLSIITAYGFLNLKKKTILAFFILLLINFSIVLFDTINKESHRFQAEKQIGYSKLAAFIKENFDKYSKIYVTDSYGSNPGPALLFWLNYPPEEFLKSSSSSFGYRFWINKIGKIKIGNYQEASKELETLYIITPAEEKFFFDWQLIKIGEIKENENTIYEAMILKK